MALLAKLRSLFQKAPGTSMIPSSTSAGWWPIIREPFPGAWQRNLEVNEATASTHYAVFSCQTLIARDIGKLGGPLLVARDSAEVWKPVDNPAYSPVLRKPNHFQNRNQFWEQWILSKLITGNTYVLKERDNRRVVTGLYILNPRRVTVLVSKPTPEYPNGEVFYQCDTDELSGIEGTVTIPASEIIHDRMNTLHHPLVGIPPIYASALAATQGLNIQNQSINLFANNAQPGGILLAPGNIEDADVERIKAHWQERFTGRNFGKVAVLGSNLKYEKLSLTAVEGQLIEQLKWTAETICSTFHVPPFKIFVGPVPSYDNVQALEQIYYSSALQTLIEDSETCLDEGLGLSENANLGVEFPIKNLMRMDTARQAEAVVALVRGAIMTPNEARLEFNLPKIAGGDTVYMQEQDIPMSVAASRTVHPTEAKAAAEPSRTEPPGDDDESDAELTDDDKALAAWRIEKTLDVMLART